MCHPGRDGHDENGARFPRNQPGYRCFVQEGRPDQVADHAVNELSIRGLEVEDAGDGTERAKVGLEVAWGDHRDATKMSSFAWRRVAAECVPK